MNILSCRRGYENERAKDNKEMEEKLNNRFVIELKDASIQVRITIRHVHYTITIVDFCFQACGNEDNSDFMQLQHAIEESKKEKSLLLANHSQELINLK